MMCGTPQQLTDLPWQDIIFQHIFPHLSVAELCRLCAVSKAFQNVSNEYFYTCKQMDVSYHRINDDQFQKIISRCRNLHWLSVAGCAYLSDAPLMVGFKQNPNLVHVDLGKCDNLTGGALQVLAVRCKKLKSLCVQRCPWFTAGCLQVLVLHQPEIHKINVSDCWSIGDQDLVQLFQKFTKLKEVRLNLVESITDTTLYHLATHCQQLEVLELSGCFRITDKGIKKVVDACSVLKSLDVKGCPNISEQYLCCLYATRIKMTSNYPLADMIKRRRYVDQLQINVQI
ncbi:F-box/LRR-repeat protein 15 [Chionoecetes opilio]|uniref:F-box/LRR-repeat protein 15 n=1 Tax=Chionoecetes opilio TaxID=41210 RepID=A0A8J4YDG9_CHIOP|nr:F-box/LRR-repeat protein 15 [Chionoecetes opilio]